MIYTMPFNQSVADLIPPQPTTQELNTIKSRIAAGLSDLGYEVISEGIFLGPNGEFNIEANADPSVDWPTFVPPDKAPEELIADEDRLFVEDALPQLKTDSLPSGSIQRVIGWLAEQELARLDGA